jgi:hypothetical protein
MTAAKFSLRPYGRGIEVDRDTLDVIFTKMSRFGWDTLTLTLQSPYFLREVSVWDAPTLTSMWQVFRLRGLARKAMPWHNLFSHFYDSKDVARVRNSYSEEELGNLVNTATNKVQ